MSKKDELVGFQVLSMIYKTKTTKKYLNRKPWQAPDFCEIKSYIPGTIVKINVKVGDKVKEGESLLVLEAMKMLNQIAMPFDGKIKEICVSEGDKVPKNHLMIVIEE
ncbi:Biotin-requiring enzyme [Saccharicrinis carchari]|uniref:Biotin-requiring enzyme n=1 Tax=Saccharicrinis carchari TaxID=1168039 RepID=A0A521ELS5_SACCC|nr:acetyl-CoA carboxylase biotin carboxyl carrier protein subunit [Saccharicrinis carchari]SMO84869.1 Biotin-requiring enzyme [Saccharicrinis carchari]